MTEESKLPDGDQIDGRFRFDTGVFEYDRIHRQTLEEIQVFINSAISLFGGGSKLTLHARSGGRDVDYINIEPESEIRAREDALAKLTPEDRKALGL